MMNKKDRLGDILHIILRACALNFGAGPRGGAGDEEDRSITNEEPIIPSVDEHGLKGLDIFDDNNGVAMWKWIKILYHEVAQETTLKDSYRITLVPSSDGISVCGKLFNRGVLVDIANLILRNREVLFREPKRGIDEYLENDSFLQ
ncbi:hypothetical protein FOB22_006762 [Saccharomyces cerevisiae]|nr:hypothetical protein FOB22_006762 [Saccharomyces cerevisiae]